MTLTIDRPHLRKSEQVRSFGSALALVLTCVVSQADSALAEHDLFVEVVRIKKEQVVRTTSLVGEIAARTKLVISFPQGGRVDAVVVEEGDRVAAGAVLARIDSARQEQAVIAAEAGVATATADVRQARADLDRQEQLLERGATTPVARDAAQDALDIAEGALAQAETALTQARKSLNDTVLYAPEAATVTARLVEQGEVVGAAQPVLELALGGELDAIFDVPEALLTANEGSAKLSLSMLSGDTTPFSGFARKVSPIVDSASGTVRVTIGVEGAPKGTTYGDPVRGTVERIESGRIVIPFEALTATARGPAVWQVDPDDRTVALKDITVARYETEDVVVASGLEEGTLVVTKGAQLLYPGRPVAFSEGAK